MSLVPLRIGSLAAEGYVVHRSGIRWLKENGQHCHPGELIAYCNIRLMGRTYGDYQNRSFSAEERDLQVGFAVKVGGRLCYSKNSSLGGFLDLDGHYQEWRPEFTIGQIEPDAECSAGDDPQTLLLFMFAGRRVTELAEVRSGLMSGWHSRTRVWSGEAEPHSTLLSLGICEQLGVVRGERWAFQELLDGICGPAQIVYVPDHLLVPSALVLLEQTKRSAAQFEEIAADIPRTWQEVGTVPTPDDWIFIGTLLASMKQKPLAESYDVLTRVGVNRIRPADVVLLSMHSESSHILRHKRLGYSLACHEYRVREAGPGVRQWLRTEFEPVRRTPEMIRRDLRNLIQTVRERAATEFLIMNVMSTSGFEDLVTYSPFERPIGNVLKTHSMKEMNLMLHDLAREYDVSIVDTDAIAADLGAEAHLPDGVHQSGPLQAEIRQEIIRLLTARGVPGFASAGIR